MLNKYTKREIIKTYKQFDDGSIGIFELVDGFEFLDSVDENLMSLKVYEDKYYVNEVHEDVNLIFRKYSTDTYMHRQEEIIEEIVNHLKEMRKKHS